MKLLKKILILSACICAPLIGFAQVSFGTGTVVYGKYSYTPINFPSNTVVGNAGVIYLGAGWPVITSYTNILNLWNSSSNAFVSTTNVISVTNTTYAQWTAAASRYTAIEHQFTTSSSTSTSNEVFGYTLSVTGDFSTNSTSLKYFTNSANGNGYQAGVNLIDMGGYGYGRIITYQWSDATAGDVLTNQGLNYSIKQGAAQ